MIYTLICVISLGFLSWQFNAQLCSMSECTCVRIHTQTYAHSPSLYWCWNHWSSVFISLKEQKLTSAKCIANKHRPKKTEESGSKCVNICMFVPLFCLFTCTDTCCIISVGEPWLTVILAVTLLLFIKLPLNMISLTVGGHFGTEGLAASTLTNCSVPKTPVAN